MRNLSREIELTDDLKMRILGISRNMVPTMPNQSEETSK